MAATYDPSGVRSVDLVRKRLGDTGIPDGSGDGPVTITQAISSDEEILKFIELYGTEEGTARLAESHAAYYNLEPEKVDQKNGMSFSYGDRSSRLLRIATSIRGAIPRESTSGRYGYDSGTLSVSNDVQF